VTRDDIFPTVDVCVVTWNTAELTAEALRKLLDTDQGCTLRVLVRDNGSTDGTAERLRNRVPEADVDAGTDNLGFAAGVNTILARSTAPWVMLLNSDAWPDPGAIGRLIAAAKDHPRAAAIAPRLERPDGTLEHSTYPFPSIRVAATMSFARGHLSSARANELMLEGDWKHDVARPVDWAVGAALLIRREALDEIGGLDERYFMYVEDVEWCWRAHRHGWEIWFEPSAVVRHVGNASGEQRYGGRRTRAYMVNTYAFFRREHGALATLLYRTINVIGCGWRYVVARARGDTEQVHFWHTLLVANLARGEGR